MGKSKTQKELDKIAEKLNGVKYGSKRHQQLMAELDELFGEETPDEELESEWAEEYGKARE